MIWRTKWHPTGRTRNILRGGGGSHFSRFCSRRHFMLFPVEISILVVARSPSTRAKPLLHIILVEKKRKRKNQQNKNTKSKQFMHARHILKIGYYNNNQRHSCDIGHGAVSCLLEEYKNLTSVNFVQNVRLTSGIKTSTTDKTK